MGRILVLVVLVMAQMRLDAQSDSAGRSFKDVFQLKGYVKNMQTFQMADLNYISHGNLVHNRLNFRIYPTKSMSIGLEVRNRLFSGDMVNFNPAFASSVDYDDGLLDLSWLWLSEPAVVGLSQIDRGWVKWNNEKWEVCLGRQRINWGVNAFWNSNDLFNTFNLVDFDYEERPGTDALRVQRYMKNYSSLEVAVAPSRNDSSWIGAGMYRFNKWTYDFQVLGGWWKQDLALGVGWAGNLKTAGFKGEATWFQPREQGPDSGGVLSASVSIDYVFKGNLYVMGGMLYASRGADSTLNITALSNAGISGLRPPSAKYLMPTRYNVLMSVSKPITPLVTGSLVGIYAPGVHLLFLMPSVSVSVAGNWDLSLFAQTTMLDNGSAFRNYGTSVFARLKWGF
jgi:hypothetical protein